MCLDDHGAPVLQLDAPDSIDEADVDDRAAQPVLSPGVQERTHLGQRHGAVDRSLSAADLSRGGPGVLAITMHTSMHRWPSCTYNVRRPSRQACAWTSCHDSITAHG
jgi:hypothetical protein